MPRRDIHTIVCSLAVAICTAHAAADAPGFESVIRPILERHCYECHGPDEQKSSYRLDVRETAFRGGDSRQAGIVPHDSAASELVRRITHADPAERMPPPDSEAQPLTPSDIQLLKDWIDAGPEWPDAFAGETNSSKGHWSLQPLMQPAVPPGADHPIDAFVRAQLNDAGIDPSPSADKRTLIRRLYTDLVGLPPTPEAVDAFVANTSPNAYENLVGELLHSPRYGERWARHWLDTVHYADTHGYEHDLARDHAWRYRDYVIAALNNDTPYPRFIREQLAADHFYPDETNLTAALGFLGAGNFDLSTYITSTVTFDYLDRDDVVTQTTAAFLGATANCARCHDHKFDPIPQEDYYALQAVFAGVLKGNVAYDEDPEIARKRNKWTELLAAVEAGDETVIRSEQNAKLVQNWLNTYGTGANWSPIRVETYLSAEGSKLTLGDDGIVEARGARPQTDTYTITASTELETITALRLEVFARDDLPNKGPGRADNGNLTLSEFKVQLFAPGASEPTPIDLRRATADFDQEEWQIDKAIDGKPKTGWGIHPAEGSSHVAVFDLEEPIAVPDGARLAIELKQVHGEGHLIGAVRLSATVDDVDAAIPFAASTSAALSLPGSERSDAQTLEIATAVLRHTALLALDRLPQQALVYAAAPSIEIPNGEPAENRAALEAPKPVHLMVRGDFDHPAEEIDPGALSALSHLPARFALNDPRKEAQRRAALADWIAHPENPLTWRCIVNRVWHYHFGQGICDTPSDLGRMGGEPSHLELLDWLAVWFRDEANGSLRALHRLIVTSETYKQASAIREDAAVIDSDNRLLWRQNAQRLDAEAFRDAVLALSGRLDLTMGGPADRYFIEGPGPQLTPSLDFKAYDWRNAEKSRRSIYRFVWRGIPDPLMEALDFPDLGLLSPTRTASVSSLQALALYNNDFVLAHCEALAHRVAAEANSMDEQVTRAVRLVWLRDPTTDESTIFRDFARTNGMAALCRILVNSNEFLFVG